LADTSVPEGVFRNRNVAVVEILSKKLFENSNWSIQATKFDGEMGVGVDERNIGNFELFEVRRTLLESRGEFDVESAVVVFGVLEFDEEGDTTEVNVLEVVAFVGAKNLMEFDLCSKGGRNLFFEVRFEGGKSSFGVGFLVVLVETDMDAKRDDLLLRPFGVMFLILIFVRGNGFGGLSR
jgi:hypothetical protein